MRYDWPVKKAIVDFSIRLTGISKFFSGNSLSPSGARYKDIGANSEALLTGARLRLSGSPGVTRVGEKRGPRGACT